MVISHDLFTFCARLKVCFTIIFQVYGCSEMTPSAEYPDLEHLPYDPVLLDLSGIALLKSVEKLCYVSWLESHVCQAML